MVRRAAVPLVSALALPITLLAAFASVPSSALDFAPAASHTRSEAATAEVQVEWVLRTRDLITCQTAAPDLRRIQHQYSGQVRVVAYAVASDTALVHSFLRRERLVHVDVRPITERVFQRDFAHRLGSPEQTPTLIVLHRGGQVAFDGRARVVPGGRGVNDFSAHVATLLNPAGLASNHHSTLMGGR